MNGTIDDYLEGSAEPEAQLADRLDGSFGHAIEIPAYGETDTLLRTIASVPEGPLGKVLIVVVVNARADSPAAIHEANAVARASLAKLGSPPRAVSGIPAVTVSDLPQGRLLVIDRAVPGSWIPAGQGVGLARKIGCDLVLRLGAAGRIASPWIHATDADVRLPPDYFEQIGGVDPRTSAAALYFFEHLFPQDEELARAGRLYEISLRYSVLGLAWAGSPYAYQNMGSCLAVVNASYAAVGGFPRLNAIEDVTILNALAKVGAIARLGGSPVGLDGRISTRVPVSTGQALSKIVGREPAAPGFELHHPIVFAHVAAWLRVLAAIARRGSDLAAPLGELPRHNSFFRADLLEEALGEMGAFEAVREAIATPGDGESTLRRLHEGFDGFRTRRLMDDLRDAGFPSLPLREALSEAPFTGLTASTEDDLETLRLLLSEEERSLAAIPAGVPAVRFDGNEGA